MVCVQWTPIPTVTENWQASDLARGTVAARVQSIQHRQGLGSPDLASKVQNSARSSEINAQSSRVRWANAASDTPTSLPSTGKNEASRHCGRWTDDPVYHRPATASLADETYLYAGLPAGPVTSVEATLRHQQRLAPSFPKLSPDRVVTQKTQSIGTKITPRNRLSEARSRLRSIGERTMGNPVEPPSYMHVSPSPRKLDIHGLEDLVGDVIDEQAKLDSIATSAEQSSGLRLTTSKVPTGMTRSSKRWSVETEPTGSPLRRRGSNRSSSRRRASVHALTTVGGKESDLSSVSSGQQISPTRKQRLSTESVLPRSSLDSVSMADRAYSSVCSSPQTKAVHKIFHMQPQAPCAQTPSPVKQRAAAFERMMQRDKHIMYEQAHKCNGNVHGQHPWWHDRSDNHRAIHMKGNVKQESALTGLAGQTLQHHPVTSTGAVMKSAISGPIPLALPQVISSGRRAVSTSSQSEDMLVVAPQREAALSRLSSRAQSPRTVRKTSGTQAIDTETRPPIFRWKALVLDQTTPACTKDVFLPEEPSSQANAGIESQPKQRAMNQSQAVDQNTSARHEQGQDPMGGVRQLKDIGPASTIRHPMQQIHQPQALTPERLLLGRTASVKQDHTSASGRVYGSAMEQVSGAKMHCEGVRMRPWCSPTDIAVDADKFVAVSQDVGGTEEHGKILTTSGNDVARCQTPSKGASESVSAPGASSPLRGRMPSRTLPRQGRAMEDAGKGNSVTVSRSKSKAGNVKVTVEVRTPQGSPSKGTGEKDEVAKGVEKGETVVIVTTDVQGDEEQ